MNLNRKILNLILVLSLLIGVLSFSGCAQQEMNNSDDEKIEVVNAGRLGQDLGITIKTPADLIEPQYSIIDEKIGEISFEIDGIGFVCLVEGALSSENIYETLYGINDPFTIKEAGVEGETAYSFMSNPQNVNVVNWFDETEEVAYTLYTVGYEIEAVTLEVGKKFIASQSEYTSEEEK